MERDDVLKFRKLCDVLIGENQWPLKRIAMSTGLSLPTIEKLRTSDLAELTGIRASSFAAMQDFVKRNITVLDYAGIKSQPLEETKPTLPLEINKPNLAAPNKKLTEEDRISTGGGKAQEFNKEHAANLKSQLNTHFWDLIKVANECVPDNVIITITINKSL